MSAPRGAARAASSSDLARLAAERVAAIFSAADEEAAIDACLAFCNNGSPALEAAAVAARVVPALLRTLRLHVASAKVAASGATALLSFIRHSDACAHEFIRGGGPAVLKLVREAHDDEAAVALAVCRALEALFAVDGTRTLAAASEAVPALVGILRARACDTAAFEATQRALVLLVAGREPLSPVRLAGRFALSPARLAGRDALSPARLTGRDALVRCALEGGVVEALLAALRTVEERGLDDIDPLVTATREALLALGFAPPSSLEAVAHVASIEARLIALLRSEPASTAIVETVCQALAINRGYRRERRDE
jgi:hypothetical protein